MSIEVNKRKKENFNSLLYRFNRKLRQGGLFWEVKSRQYYSRSKSKTKRRESALHRKKQEEKFKKMRRYGKNPFSRN